MNVLEIKNLSKSFGEFQLRNITLSLPQGYIMGYIGQNGAGKTTTIKLIMGHLRRDAGNIEVCGRELLNNEKYYKDTIGYIADECYFPSTYKLKDVSDIMRSFYVSFDSGKFKKYTEKWNLPGNKPVKDFSKGMKIKLTFASVLSRETDLLILDEPTSGLDPVMRTEILELLQEYISNGKKSVLFSTHIMSDLERIADYLCFIENGKVVFNNTKDCILEGFLLAKGGIDALTAEFKENVIGLSKTNIGFTALIPADKKFFAGKGVVIEKPTIDDIVVFHIKGIKEAS